LQFHEIKASILVTIKQNCVNTFSSLIKKTLDGCEKIPEHSMKCKNTRSSGKTPGVGALACHFHMFMT